MHDIYDPSPVTASIPPPAPEPLRWTNADLVWLAALGGVLFVVAGWAAAVEPSIWPWVLVGGLFVILESWFSALTFLRRHPSTSHGGRRAVFVAALVPWALELGFAAALILCLFRLGDWLR